MAGYIEDAHLSVISPITDVQEIIDDLRVKLLAIGWTEPSANTFQANDAHGRIMKIALTRVSATQLNGLMTDHMGRSATTARLDIVSGDTFAIYYGQHYLYLENRSRVEWLWWSMLSKAPEPEDCTEDYLAYCYRKTPDGTTFNTAPAQTLAFDRNSAAYQAMLSNFHIWSQVVSSVDGEQPDGSSSGGVQLTSTNARRWQPIYQIMIPQIGPFYRFRGKLYNAISALVRSVSIGLTYTMQVDGTQLKFRVLNIPAVAGLRGGAYMRAVRVP